MPVTTTFNLKSFRSVHFKLLTNSFVSRFSFNILEHSLYGSLKLVSQQISTDWILLPTSQGHLDGNERSTDAKQGSKFRNLHGLNPKHVFWTWFSERQFLKIDFESSFVKNSKFGFISKFQIFLMAYFQWFQNCSIHQKNHEITKNPEIGQLSRYSRHV